MTSPPSLSGKGAGGLGVTFKELHIRLDYNDNYG